MPRGFVEVNIQPNIRVLRECLQCFEFSQTQQGRICSVDRRCFRTLLSRQRFRSTSIGREMTRSAKKSRWDGLAIRPTVGRISTIDATC